MIQMYYDRRVPQGLLDLLRPGGPLGWVLPWLRSPEAEAAGAHLQTRSDRQDRKHGGLQLYLGRTSPLELRPDARGRLRLQADPFYRALSPDLFGRAWTVDTLDDQALHAHVRSAAQQAPRSFLEGEAVVQAGLMRRYGPLAATRPPLLALDSEVVIGFFSSQDQRQFNADLRGVLGLPVREALPRKLDLLALDEAGSLLLVEVKADATGLARAAWQAAAHVARFQALLAAQPDWYPAVPAGLASQRAQTGLLGQATPPPLPSPPELVPVIAAPSADPHWQRAWKAEIAPVLAAAGPWLSALRLWRLSGSGELLEEAGA